MRKVRTHRIAEEIKRELALIIPGKIKDPRVNGIISITGVEVTNDLSYAKVYITQLGSNNNQKDVLKGLEKAAGFIRSELGKAVRLRHVPELIFEFDSSLEYGAKIDSIIGKINESQGDNDERSSEDN